MKPKGEIMKNIRCRKLKGRYHDWRNERSLTPKQKIGQSNERN